jgi:hypothetical protein
MTRWRRVARNPQLESAIIAQLNILRGSAFSDAGRREVFLRGLAAALSRYSPRPANGPSFESRRDKLEKVSKRIADLQKALQALDDDTAEILSDLGEIDTAEFLDKLESYGRGVDRHLMDYRRERGEGVHVSGDLELLVTQISAAWRLAFDHQARHSPGSAFSKILDEIFRDQKIESLGRDALKRILK